MSVVSGVNSDQPLQPPAAASAAAGAPRLLANTISPPYMLQQSSSLLNLFCPPSSGQGESSIPRDSTSSQPSASSGAQRGQAGAAGALSALLPMPVAGSASTTTHRQLRREWVLWFDKASTMAPSSATTAAATANSELFPTAVRRMATISTMESFWEMWAHYSPAHCDNLVIAAASVESMPSVKPSYNLRVFCSGVDPSLADAACRNGGRFVIKNIPRHQRAELWTRLALSLLTERLTDKNSLDRPQSPQPSSGTVTPPVRLDAPPAPLVTGEASHLNLIAAAAQHVQRQLYNNGNGTTEGSPMAVGIPREASDDVATTATKSAFDCGEHGKQHDAPIVIATRRMHHTVLGICLCVRPDEDDASIQIWTDGGAISMSYGPAPIPAPPKAVPATSSVAGSTPPAQASLTTAVVSSLTGAVTTAPVGLNGTGSISTRSVTPGHASGTSSPTQVQIGAFFDMNDVIRKYVIHDCVDVECEYECFNANGTHPVHESPSYLSFPSYSVENLPTVTTPQMHVEAAPPGELTMQTMSLIDTAHPHSPQQHAATTTAQSSSARDESRMSNRRLTPHSDAATATPPRAPSTAIMHNHNSPGAPSAGPTTSTMSSSGGGKTPSVATSQGTGQLVRQPDPASGTVNAETTVVPELTSSLEIDDATALVMFKKMRSLRKKIRFVHHHLQRSPAALSPAELAKVQRLRVFEDELAALEAEAARYGIFPSAAERDQAYREKGPVVAAAGDDGQANDGDDAEDDTLIMLRPRSGEGPTILTAERKSELRRKIAQSLARHAERMDELKQYPPQAAPTPQTVMKPAGGATRGGHSEGWSHQHGQGQLHGPPRYGPRHSELHYELQQSRGGRGGGSSNGRYASQASHREGGGAPPNGPLTSYGVHSFGMLPPATTSPGPLPYFNNFKPTPAGNPGGPSPMPLGLAVPMMPNPQQQQHQLYPALPQQQQQPPQAYPALSPQQQPQQYQPQLHPAIKRQAGQPGAPPAATHPFAPAAAGDATLMFDPAALLAAPRAPTTWSVESGSHPPLQQPSYFQQATYGAPQQQQQGRPTTTTPPIPGMSLTPDFTAAPGGAAAPFGASRHTPPWAAQPLPLAGTNNSYGAIAVGGLPRVAPPAGPQGYQGAAPTAPSYGPTQGGQPPHGGFGQPLQSHASARTGAAFSQHGHAHPPSGNNNNGYYQHGLGTGGSPYLFAPPGAAPGASRQVYIDVQ